MRPPISTLSCERKQTPPELISRVCSVLFIFRADLYYLQRQLHAISLCASLLQIGPLQTDYALTLVNAITLGTGLSSLEDGGSTCLPKITPPAMFR